MLEYAADLNREREGGSCKYLLGCADGGNVWSGYLNNNNNNNNTGHMYMACV